MKNFLEPSDLIQIVDRMDHKFQDQKEYLSELDSEIGDGDHGFSMAKGFHQFNQLAKDFSTQSIGDILQKGGLELVKTIGGAAGAIFGTLFTGQAKYYTKHLLDKDRLNCSEVAAMWTYALEQITLIGKANPGDKTMVDALHPAVLALTQEAESGASLGTAFSNASIAARSGADATANMIGKHGRAKHLGQRSLGKVDPGAVSVVLILEIFAKYFSEQ
jgi:dihydroxyacetone kinase-like protein